MSTPEPTPPSDPSGEAAEIIRRLLGMIDDGGIDASSPKAKALQRRLEGAVVAWETSRLASTDD